MQTALKQWTVANSVTEIKEKTDHEQWGAVYAVEYGDHLKVGYTKDLIKRVKNFLHQTSYNQVKIGKVAYTPYHSNFTENEKILHTLFKPFRKKGTELFDIPLKEFLDKAPELQFDEIIFDYETEVRALKEAKAITPTTAKLIDVYDNKVLPVREYNGERVVTFQDVDYIHSKPKGTAKKNFYKAKTNFIEGIDFFKAKPSGSTTVGTAEIQNNAFREFDSNNGVTTEINNFGTIFITKMGYLMLVKSFNDQLSWIIQRTLVVKYFESQQNKDTEIVMTLTNLFQNRERVNMGAINNMIIETTASDIETVKAVIEDITFFCNVDSVAYKSKDEAKAKTAAIVKRMKAKDHIKQMTPERLAKAVTKGYSFTTAALSGTTEADFISQQLLVLDIDNERTDIPIMTVEDAKARCHEVGLIYSFMYYSFSHSTHTPKFRIVCVLDKPITDPIQAKAVNQYLITLFPQADKSCFNLDRFYYGTNNGLATEIYNRTTSIPVISDNFFEPPITTAPESDARPPQTKAVSHTAGQSGDFNYAQSKADFDLLAYVEHETGTKGQRKGKDVLFNPCPLCGHYDHFYIDTEKNLFKCHSSRNGTGGNVINYIMERRGLSKEQAREYFIYDIMGQERKGNKKELNKRMIENKISKIESKTPRHSSLEEKLKQMAVHETYSLNDRAYGDLFGDLYKTCCRYNATAGQWYYYDGKVWLEDTGGLNVSRKAKELFDALLIHAVSLGECNQKMNFLDYVIKYGKLSRREVLVKDARDFCPIYQANLDKNTDLLNCQNGTFNLKTFKLQPHSQDDLLSKISNIVYDPNAKSPLFEKFIDDIMLGDEAKKDYLQKILGYALTADTQLETCFMLYGATTRNGKGTLMETILHMLGSTAGYAMTIKPETLAAKNNKDSRQASGDIARLAGCRFLNCSEPPKRMIFDIALLKNLLGRDTITARHLYESEFEFIPAFKLFINTNFLPVVTDDTLFSSGRVNILTFDRHFEPHEQNKGLKDELKKPENISGIFNWCVKGLKKFRKYGAEPPQSVLDSTADYRANSDKIGNFISECLEKTGKNSKAGTVYDAYKKWCESNGFGCENKGNFFDELRSKNIYAKNRSVNGVTETNVVVGYEVIDEEPQTPEEPPHLKPFTIKL